MPFDIVYAATLSESGKISQGAVGYFSLTFVPLQAGQDGKRSNGAEESQDSLEIRSANSEWDSLRDSMVSGESELLGGGAPNGSGARGGDRESSSGSSGELETLEAEGRALIAVANGNGNPSISTEIFDSVAGEMREASAISLRDISLVDDKPLKLRPRIEGPYNKPKKGRFNFGWFGGRE